MLGCLLIQTGMAGMVPGKNGDSNRKHMDIQQNCWVMVSTLTRGLFNSAKPT